MTSTYASTSAAEADLKSSLVAKTPNWLRLAQNACLRVPPLWPLHSFVAVNPFVGLAGKPFAEVSSLMQRIAHEGMLMSAEYFQQQFSGGRITPSDLLAAIQQEEADISLNMLLDWLKNPEQGTATGLQSLADIATARHGGPWSTWITEEISKWCSAYFDEGQSAWRLPWKKQTLFTAWRQAAMIDANSELIGFKSFRKLVAELPESSAEALSFLLGTLAVPADLAGDYLHRLLMTLPGWSSYAQYRVRERAMNGMHDESLLDLLVVRLAFEVQLARQFESAGIHQQWMESLAGQQSTADPALQKQLLWHSALEIGFQQELCSQIKGRPANLQSSVDARPEIQAVFCIDVRSEIMRRSLEASSVSIETLGFAGFFGMPIEFVPFGRRHGTSQVPVLFSPKYRIRGYMPNATPELEKSTRRKMQLGRRLDHSLNAFKNSPISSFSFVEAAGIGYAWKLVKDSFRLSDKRETQAFGSCFSPNLCQTKHISPDLLEDPQPEAGIPPEDQAQLALGALKNMGLTSHFARLVMLCGHGSETKNNPYAAGLDCGACGGHAGDPNARIAAAILNQAPVREALKGHGIHIPDDTHFTAALHNTTTDEITLFDADKIPLTHEMDLTQLRHWLGEASKRCREQRAANLGLNNLGEAALEKSLLDRSCDWSQTRPEWGLAGNAAFVAAPRERTRKLDLKGRVFLHNYDHTADTTKSTLELIMTAPMVVANWINLQYYASTVNNRLWGSGNKVTHNVVGTFGIQQGNGGDLRSGLPMQSVHNGENWMHEPLRLSVLIEAPRSDIDVVIANRGDVRELVENGWLHLFAIEDEGHAILKRDKHGEWQPV